MTILDFGLVDSGTVGMASALDLMTISIGFSKAGSIGLVATSSLGASTCGVRSLMAASVISVSGVLFNCVVSGEIDGLGVGSDGGGSNATEILAFFAASALLRFVGDVFFVGEIGSIDKLGSASKI